MEFWLRIRDGKVDKATFITDGCGPALASGSMATELARGKRLEQVAAFQQKDILEALDGLPAEVEHCALLAAHTLLAACEDYLTKRASATGGGSSAEEQASRGARGDPTPVAWQRLQGESEKDFEARRRLHSRLERIRHKIVVLSGKGGVGKSTIAVNLAVALSQSGAKVGLLDVDIHGPSVPTLLGLERHSVQVGGGEILPAEVDGLKVVSLGFFLQNQDDAVIWRGPMKMGAIQQFLRDVAWGDLDFLVVDSPPGTGDEPLSVCQLLGTVEGAVIVTTPQKVAVVDVRKCVSFCRQLQVPVLGVVENMSGFVCPRCGEVTSILSSGGGQSMARDMHVPFLGSIPMDPTIAEACDEGRAFIRRYADSPTAEIMREIIRPIAALDRKDSDQTEEKTLMEKEVQTMRIAIPLAQGRLSLHFGHCERFALVDVDTTVKKIVGQKDVDSPPHQPGLLPAWLAEQGAQVIIAGGMGQRAQALFSQKGIEVVVGAGAETPERLVEDYLAGTLEAGENICDH
jgi:Mrp family chromosome partitioning ATPase/predicted Fe-Mo cluster-binding NifX family protein